MSVEVYNRTKYNDEVLRNAAELAHEICGIEGDVAVVFRYYTGSKYIGFQHNNYPYFHQVAGRLKKFAHRKYKATVNSRITADPFSFTSATEDGSYGYITVRMPRAKKYLLSGDAKAVMNTILHEMFHIKQERNRQWALKDSGYTSWVKFEGYTGAGRSKRVAHQKRGIEQHVNRLLRDIQPVLDTSVEYDHVIESLVQQFTDEKIINKAKKQKQSVKYNKYGERMSDYRNVKMKRLRSGDEIVICPHCGEQAVNLYGDMDTFTHIASVDNSAVAWSGLSPSECRTTQFGHMIYSDGSVGVVEFGYVNPSGEVSEDVFKSFNNNFYRG